MKKQFQILIALGFVMSCSGAVMSPAAAEEAVKSSQAVSVGNGLKPFSTMPEGMGKDVEDAARENSAVIKDVYQLLALSYRTIGQDDNAILMNEKLNKFAGDEAPALYRIAEIHLKYDRVKEAEAVYERLVKATPQIIENYYPLIEVYQNTHQDDKLKALLKEAEAANSGNPMVLARIAEMRSKMTGVPLKKSEPASSRKAAEATVSKKSEPAVSVPSEPAVSVPSEPTSPRSEPRGKTASKWGLSRSKAAEPVVSAPIEPVVSAPVEPAASQGEPAVSVPSEPASPVAPEPPVSDKKEKNKWF